MLTMSPRRSVRMTIFAAAVVLATACGAPDDTGSPTPTPGPIVIIPPGVVSSRTADQVARMMLAEIAQNERTLGRALARAQIIRIQLLRPGEMYEFRHFDGTNPEGVSMGPDGGPGWMVEAIGTFIGTDRRTGMVDSLGIHGFHEWDDAGSEGFGFNPCWSLILRPAASMDGVCR